MDPRQVTSVSEWAGAVFLKNRKVIFCGAAGTAIDQKIHGIKICIALNGDFEVSTNSGVGNKLCSAVIINAGVTHTIKCRGNHVFLLYLLPETLASISIRKEFLYDGRGEFYDIPKILIEQSLPLKKILQEYSSWDCEAAFKAADDVINGLGKIRGRQFSTSTKLSDNLSKNTKRTIRYIYDEIEAQILSEKFDESKFTLSAIARKLELGGEEIEHLKLVFRKETGISIEHFFRDIQMLAALKLYAFKEGLRTNQEDELIEALEDPTLTEEEREAIGERLDAIPRGVYLTEIAELLGFSSLANFGARIKSRLGISIADLRGGTNFYSCPDQKTEDEIAT